MRGPDWYSGSEGLVYQGVQSVMPGVVIPSGLIDWVLGLVASERDISREAWELMRPLTDALYEIARIDKLSWDQRCAFWAIAGEQERVALRAIRARRVAQATIVVLEILRAQAERAAARAEEEAKLWR